LRSYSGVAPIGKRPVIGQQKLPGMECRVKQHELAGQESVADILRLIDQVRP
jgi:hypothetical protein